MVVQAVLCSRCRLLAAPGDYGALTYADTGTHSTVEGESGFAEPCESTRDPEACEGSNTMGQVVEAEWE